MTKENRTRNIGQKRQSSRLESDSSSYTSREIDDAMGTALLTNYSIIAFVSSWFQLFQRKEEEEKAQIHAAKHVFFS